MLLEKVKEYSNTDYIAINDGDKTLGFKELFERSQAFAWYLRDNYDLNRPIAIYGDKENDIIIAAFGALYAKKTYVIIPDIYPIDRVNYILKDCNPDLVFNVSNKDSSFDCGKIININDVESIYEEYRNREELQVDYANYDKTALIIYTSGSTGRPKGIEISYRNLEEKVNYCVENNIKVVDEFNKSGKMFATACMSSYGFVVSLDFVFRIGGLGTAWYPIKTEIVKDTKKLFAYLKQIQVNAFTITPSLLRKLFEDESFNENSLYNLKRLCLGGEPVYKDIVEELFKRFSNIYFINGYGATETCGGGSLLHITDEEVKVAQNIMPISKFHESYLILIDENENEITDENTEAEIAIFGNCVALQYHNNEELSKQRFSKLADGRRIYKTGDRGFYKDNYLYITGRADNQVKVGGNRIEIEDVEQHLNSSSIVCESAVGIQTHNNINSLIALVVLNNDGKELDQVNAFLTIKKEMMKIVESFKIPQKILFVDSLPKTVSNKIDRNTLKKVIKELSND